MHSFLTWCLLVTTFITTRRVNPVSATEIDHNTLQNSYISDFSLERFMQEVGNNAQCDFENDVPLQMCNSTLFEYDTSGDGLINRGDEYVNFVMNMIGNTNYVEGSVSFVFLYPLRLIEIFNNAACLCDDDECDGCVSDVDIQDEDVVCYLCDRLLRFIDTLEQPTVAPSLMPSVGPSTMPTGKPSSAPTGVPVPSPSALPTCGYEAVVMTMLYPLTTQAGVDAAAILSETDNYVKKQLINATIATVESELESETSFYDQAVPPSIDDVVDTQCDVDDLQYASASIGEAISELNCAVVTSSITVFANCETDQQALQESLALSFRMSLANDEFCQFIPP